MQIKPQDWFQMDFLSSSADIVIGWSGAWVGKTFSLLLEWLRNTPNKDFNFVFFRRTRPEITNAWGMRDESLKLYSKIKWAIPSVSTLSWQFPSWASWKFAWLEHEKDIYNWQGSQICLIWFDELTHFSKKMFFYLLSRNRSTSWIKPYIRATCNPDPYSWVADFISWWIDEDSWMPIPERAWKIRYFLQDNDSYLRWDSIDDLLNTYPYLLDREDFKINKPEDLIKSVTFIPGSIYNNKKLLEIDPWYLWALMSQTEEEKKKLLDWCWKPFETPTMLFSYQNLKDLFWNYTQLSNEMFISCDVALFGSDLAVIGVWKWLQLVKCYIYSLSSWDKIKSTIESERKANYIPKSNVVIDADWVGWWVADEDYTRFHNNWATIDKENYANIKTQCVYKLSDKIKEVSLKDCEWYVDWIRTDTVKKWWKVLEIKEILIKELSAIRRANIDKDWKLQINSKSEQKWIIWWSPDIADMIIMRMYFELWKKYLWFL